MFREGKRLWAVIVGAGLLAVLFAMVIASLLMTMGAAR